MPATVRVEAWLKNDSGQAADTRAQSCQLSGSPPQAAPRWQSASIAARHACSAVIEASPSLAAKSALTSAPWSAPPSVGGAPPEPPVLVESTTPPEPPPPVEAPPELREPPVVVEPSRWPGLSVDEQPESNNASARATTPNLREGG